MYSVNSQSKYRLMYHLVWVPKYRKRILKGAVKERLELLFRQCVDVNNWQLEELNVQEDHVHMLVKFPPVISVSKAVQLLKGGSSRVLRKEFSELEEFLWGKSFWADGYFAETIGRISESSIRKYIQNQ